MENRTKEKETYTSALKRLQEIVTELEEENVDIDELTKKLAEAQRLLTFCKKKLTKTEEEAQKILETMQ
ncbi:MAG: exodeoxyribonuclease VII small subunit [Bacteroidaceae bacterium]|jgi:exodeoxyribonuclease VII small subunit